MNLSLTLAKYELHLRAVDTLVFPRYKGSTLRGGFGSTFKRLTCCQSNSRCESCLVRVNCPYHYVFETSPPEGTRLFVGYSDVPRPFVIEPPIEEKDVFEPGEELKFGLVLVGKAIEYLPYFVVVFQSLGEEGIGRQRGRFEVTKVTAPFKSGQVVYDGEGCLDQTGTAISLESIQKQAEKVANRKKSLAVTIRFEAPLRIVKNGSLQDNLDFGLFFRALIRRISSLVYFHGGEEVPLEEIRSLIQAAEGVHLLPELYWYDWERYSRRQKCRMKLGGIIGHIYIPELPVCFLSWVLMGELLHVGKGATFGLGKYRVNKV